jgi:hypothetical protein
MTHRTLGEGWKHCVLHFAGAPAAFLYQEYTRESGFTFHMNASVNFHRQLLKLLNAYTEQSLPLSTGIHAAYEPAFIYHHHK